MDKIFYFIAALFMVTYVWLLQEEFQAWDQQRQLIKNANNKALQAALNESIEDYGVGELRIRPAEARAYFDQYLQQNLGLNTNFDPEPGAPVHASVHVLDFQIVDHTTHRFPFLYEDANYHITRLLREPAVIAVIEIDYPSLVRRANAPPPIRVPGVYEYVRPGG